jgi:serine/threonine protein phosphatase PrpC
MLRGDSIIAQHLQSQNDLPTIGQNLINAANQAGGEDNISVVLAQLLPN